MQQNVQSLIGQEIMSIDEWASIQDNPRQRDTDNHARKSTGKHLKHFAKTQARVSAAKLPDGKLIKLDGHTRGQLWVDGLLDPPHAVQVDIYPVQDIEEAKFLYDTFDNPGAVESASDRLFGACRENGFIPVSYLVKNRGVYQALLLVNQTQRSNVDIHNMIRPWIDVLSSIDARCYSQKRFTSSIIAACMLTTKIYGSEAYNFWDKFNDDAGFKNGKQRDGVQALSEILFDFRAKKLTGIYRYQVDLLCKALSCYEAYRSKRIYVGGVFASDLKTYLGRLNTTNRKD